MLVMVHDTRLCCNRQISLYLEAQLFCHAVQHGSCPVGRLGCHYGSFLVKHSLNDLVELLLNQFSSVPAAVFKHD